MEASQSGNSQRPFNQSIAPSCRTADPEVTVPVYWSPRKSIVPMLDRREFLLLDEYATAPYDGGIPSRTSRAMA